MCRHIGKIGWSRSLVLVTFVLASVAPAEVGAQDFPLFVSDYRGADGIYSLDSGGVLTIRGLVPGRLNSVREDKDGNLYTCSADSPNVSKIDPTGNVTVYATGFKSCFGLLFAVDGSLYVSDVYAGRIAVVPPGGGSFATLATGLDTPMHMAWDTDDSILVTESGAGQLSRVDANGNVSVVAAGLENPVGVAVGPGGTVYVSEVLAGRITGVDRTGNTSLVASLDGAGPAGLAFHRDGRLFVAEYLAGRIVAVDTVANVATVFRDGLGWPVGLSFHETSVFPTVKISVDLKPGSDDNPLNPESMGVVPVAVLGSEAFDATRIDPSTVRFGITGGEAAPVKSHVEDVNGDGRPDMIFQFPNHSLGIPPTAAGNSLVPLKLTGQTLDGQPIEGEDVARITPSNEG